MAVSHTFTLLSINIGRRGARLPANAGTCVGILEEVGWALFRTFAVAGLKVENLWRTADNVLGTSALAAGRILFKRSSASDWRTLTITNSWIEPSRRETIDWLAPWFAFTVEFIRDAQLPDANGDP